MEVRPQAVQTVERAEPQVSGQTGGSRSSGGRSSRAKVLIIGAGFAGLAAAKALVDSAVDVVVVDKNNYHTFFPLLYQVAAAELEPEGIAYPVRSILRKQANADFVLAEVTQVDLDARIVETSRGPLAYDYLIVATGSTTNYFGVAGAREHSFPLRALSDGVALRSHILTCLEAAAHEEDLLKRRELLTFVIVGGGPTGVEFAGALMELIHGPIAKDFSRLPVDDFRVAVIEAQDRVFSAFPDKLSAYTGRRLREMGVDVLLSSAVDRIESDGVLLKDGSKITAGTIVWTAGVGGDIRLGDWGLPVGRGGRAQMEPTLQVPNRPEVFVIGDAGTPSGQNIPMLAPAAMQEGEHAARNVLRAILGQTPLSYEYLDLGTMAVIGRNSAVANLYNKFQFTGYLAWLVWLVIHIARLIGFRNRLAVLMNWAWDYFFFERAARLALPVSNTQRST